ncbi:MAG: hypothetical protein ACLFTJ_09635, partial [Halothece sp.]
MNWTKLRQILIIFIAGIFLFVTTACGTPSPEDTEVGGEVQEVPSQLTQEDTPEAAEEEAVEEETPEASEEEVVEEET